MIFCEFGAISGIIEGRIIGWAHDGQFMHAAVLVDGKPHDVRLIDMLQVWDVSRGEIKKEKRRRKRLAKKATGVLPGE